MDKRGGQGLTEAKVTNESLRQPKWPHNCLIWTKSKNQVADKGNQQRPKGANRANGGQWCPVGDKVGQQGIAKANKG
jgi:hypothetical protein